MSSKAQSSLWDSSFNFSTHQSLAPPSLPSASQHGQIYLPRLSTSPSPFSLSLWMRRHYGEPLEPIWLMKKTTLSGCVLNRHTIPRNGFPRGGEEENLRNQNHKRWWLILGRGGGTLRMKEGENPPRVEIKISFSFLRETLNFAKGKFMVKLTNTEILAKILISSYYVFCNIFQKKLKFP